MIQEEVLLQEELKEELSSQRDLILFNDDYNTFDFVIQSLIEVCEHESEQAEQCAMIAHFNGSCGVRSGGYQELFPYWKEMADRGLSVEIG